MNHIIRQHPRYLHVVDQSYADYTLSPTLEPKEMTDCYNVMLIHSLSKKYCVPGLRLGYIFSSPIIIGRLRDLRQPWTVNAMAIEAGKYLVEHDAKMIPDLDSYLMEATRLREELSAIDGLKVTALPLATARSLRPTFVPARLVCLAVRPPFATTLPICGILS